MAETIINLTVIGDRACSTTRTYLEHLRAAGYRAKRLWLIDFSPESRRRRILRNLLGNRIATALAGLGGLGRARGQQDKPYADLCMRLQAEAGCTPIDHFSSWQPDEHAEEVCNFRARDFEDPALHARMMVACDTAYLYTNGGIVPAALLDRPEIRILHIHPGIIPGFRGSDCMLWSAAVRKQLGASCFYMSPGIDEGALIGQREFALPRLPSLAPLLTPAEEPTAYRALLYAVDPHLRAQLLVDVLRANSGCDLRDLPARLQARPSRPAYLWMHPRMRLHVMKESFL